MFRSFQIIIRDFRRSLLNLSHILVLRSLRRTPIQLHPLQQIPTQHDMLPQNLFYKKQTKS